MFAATLVTVGGSAGHAAEVAAQAKGGMIVKVAGLGGLEAKVKIRGKKGAAKGYKNSVTVRKKVRLSGLNPGVYKLIGAPVNGTSSAFTAKKTKVTVVSGRKTKAKVSYKPFIPPVTFDVYTNGIGVSFCSAIAWSNPLAKSGQEYVIFSGTDPGNLQQGFQDDGCSGPNWSDGANAASMLTYKPGTEAQYIAVAMKKHGEVGPYSYARLGPPAQMLVGRNWQRIPYGHF